MKKSVPANPIEITPLYLFGAGVRARLVAELVNWQLQHQFNIVGFFDDFQAAGSTGPGDKPVLGDFEIGIQEVRRAGGSAFIATGTKRSIVRCQLFARLVAQQIRIASVIPPNVFFSPSATIGASSLVMPGTFMGAGTKVGALFCAHGGAVVEHDCRIGHNVMLGPGVSIAGGCTIGRCTFLGAGVTVAPNISIGEGVLIGAGSVVVHDIPAHVIAYGSPASVKRDVREGDEVAAAGEFQLLSPDQWQLLNIE